MEKLDVAVIGAGVVGLAVARQMAKAGRDVVVLERGDTFGSQTSSRNSEVIHAGIYYPKDSWKARLCVEGRERLYDYCRSHGVGHRRCGKLIVAGNEAEVPGLTTLMERARGNGVPGLRLLSKSQARDLEPEVTCAAALLSPETGIVDSHGLMLSYLGEAEDQGAMIAYEAPVSGGRITDGGADLQVSGAHGMTLSCNLVINCAGHGAPVIAQQLEGFPRDQVPTRYFLKGTYFACSGRNPFTHLIYPLPPQGSLGIHVTMDLAGQLRFGPDSQWVEGVDYDLDPARVAAVYESVSAFWPGVMARDLHPSYAGVRPKLHGPCEGAADFVIQDQSRHGCPGLINLFGFESPGLTSSLAIAKEVARRAGH